MMRANALKVERSKFDFGKLRKQFRKEKEEEEEKKKKKMSRELEKTLNSRLIYLFGWLYRLFDSSYFSKIVRPPLPDPAIQPFTIRVFVYQARGLQSADGSGTSGLMNYVCLFFFEKKFDSFCFFKKKMIF